MKRHLLKNGQIIIIKEANEEDDAVAIRDLVNSVASEKYYVVPVRSREDWDEAIREIRKRKGLIIVACANEKTAGMAHLVPGKFEKTKHVGFLGVSILKGFRGIGIGTVMMNYMMGWAEKQKGLEKISLTVFSTNETAISFIAHSDSRLKE